MIRNEKNSFFQEPSFFCQQQQTERIKRGLLKGALKKKAVR
jgi:hypothetical protein